MSNRYRTLCTLPGNLYIDDAPVIILAGVLLADDKIGKILVQLKFTNIQNKRIKALTVAVLPGDVQGQPLGQVLSHQYLDFSAARGENFGDNTPIVLPDVTTRTFSVAVTKVVFEDNSVWEHPSTEWTSIFGAPNIRDYFQDAQLQQQYLITYGSGARFIYRQERDLWHCVCGAVNHQSENHCYRCHVARADIAVINMERLKEDCAERMEEEARVAAERQHLAQERKAAGKRAAIVGIAILFFLIVAGNLLNDYANDRAEKNRTYNEAQELFDNKSYDEAEEKFASLGDFKDSQDKRKEAKKLYDKAVEKENQADYKTAENLLAEGNSARAYDAFVALGDYKDSKARSEEAKLQNQLETFSESQSEFSGKRLQYTLMDTEQIKSVITSRQWIVPLSYKEAYTMITFAGDGTGTTDKGDSYAWKVDDHGFHYQYVRKNKGVQFSETKRTQFRKINDSVYVVYDVENEDNNQVFIDASSKWGKRFIKAYKLYVDND